MTVTLVEAPADGGIMGRLAVPVAAMSDASLFRTAAYRSTVADRVGMAAAKSGTACCAFN